MLENDGESEGISTLDAFWYIINGIQIKEIPVTQTGEKYIQKYLECEDHTLTVRQLYYKSKVPMFYIRRFRKINGRRQELLNIEKGFIITQREINAENQYKPILY